jgi:hypothetical protein
MDIKRGLKRPANLHIVQGGFPGKGDVAERQYGRQLSFSELKEKYKC